MLLSSLQNRETVTDDTNTNTNTNTKDSFDTENYRFFSPYSISNRCLSAAIKLLDSTVYLDKSFSSSSSETKNKCAKNLVPIRGYLSLDLKKEIQIDQIQIKLIGFNKQSLFLLSSDKIMQSYKNDHLKILNDEIIYTKENNNLPKSIIGQPQNFEFMFLIDNHSSQSLTHYFGTIEYKIEVEIISSSHNYYLSKEVKTVDIIPLNKITYADSSGLGNWRNLAYYQFVLSNTYFTIGDFINVKLDIIPIISFKVKLKSLKIYLYQTVSYNYKPLKFKNAEKYLTEIHQQDKILLLEVPIGKLITTDCFQSNFKINLENLYTDEKLRPIKIYPTTTSTTTNFQTLHHLKIGITLQELQSTPSSPRLDNHSISLSPVTSTETVQFQTKTNSHHHYHRIYELDKPSSEIEYIKSTAKLIPEINFNNQKVELVSEKSITILKPESKFGMLAPPKYCIPINRKQTHSSILSKPPSSSLQKRLFTATSLISTKVRSGSISKIKSAITSNGLLTPVTSNESSNESLKSGYCYDNGIFNDSNTKFTGNVGILGSMFGPFAEKKKYFHYNNTIEPPSYDQIIDDPPKYDF